jgi:hypothetical protein
MAIAIHSQLSGSDLHKAYAWTYTDEAARTAATGFESSNIGSIALQADDNSLWVLTATTPTWLLLNPTATPQAAVSDPSGGSVVDEEARSAIDAIIDALQTLGLMGTTT